MSRLTKKQYQRHVIVAMSLYIALMMLAWPLVRTAIGTPLKVLVVLITALPVIYVMGILARYIHDSDELEQRTHLVGLSVATMVVGSLSLAGGFLASAGVLHLDGSILVFVFPVMMISYGVTRAWISRRYGISMLCEEEAGFPSYLRFLIAAFVLAAIAFFARHALGEDAAAALCGMASVFALAGVIFGIVRWRVRQHIQDGET